MVSSSIHAIPPEAWHGCIPGRHALRFRLCADTMLITTLCLSEMIVSVLYYTNHDIRSHRTSCGISTSHRFTSLRLCEVDGNGTSMKGSSYRERDYAFGQIMLTLRTIIGLTQTELADLLGVTRRAVADW